ncbi:MAG TPA: hypothetical protein VNO30_48115 [Kofleriaceae bacterium]|nr:hypothetical protein [Kofleriaceae bacterium]
MVERAAAAPAPAVPAVPARGAPDAPASGAPDAPVVASVAAAVSAASASAAPGDRAAWLPWCVFGVALVVLVGGAAGGPGWTAESADAVLAAGLERRGSAPLYGIVAGAVAYLLPVGEPGFRLAAASAAFGALALVGVMRAARALLPKEPVAGAVAAVLLLLAPPFRDAAGRAGPAMLAACGAVWAIAVAAGAAREPSPRRAAGALLCAGVTIGAAPWLGALLAIGIVLGLGRARADYRDVLAACAGGLGLLLVVLWAGARGPLPAADPDLAAVVAASGRGAAGVVVGAGLLGAAFAAATRLPRAGWLAAAIAVAIGHAIAFDHEPAALLALFAVGAAIVPGAVVRAAAAAAASGRRHAMALVAGVPLVLAALAAGAAPIAEDPGDSPARLATDLLGELPPGPGVFVATRPAPEVAIRYAQRIAGARPDLQLAPPTDKVVVEALRRGGIAGADAPSLGRLDPRRALPRGRGFQLLAEPPAAGAPVPPPARYRTPIGERESIALALGRARYEGSYARLDLAARAAGLLDRFRAADLAILSIAAPTRARPALFGFIPPLGDAPPGDRALLDLFGDDLAWVAGLSQPDASGPPERVLHALWRKIWRGELSPADPAIVALGVPAVLATYVMLAELSERSRAPKAPEGR